MAKVDILIVHRIDIKTSTGKYQYWQYAEQTIKKLNKYGNMFDNQSMNYKLVSLLWKDNFKNFN